MPQYECMLVSRTMNISSAPTFAELDRIVELENLYWSKELNNDGMASVSTRPERVSDLIKDRLLQPDVLPMELWIYRNGVKVYAGPVIGYQIQGVNNTITFQSRGLAYYMRWMFLTSDMTNASIDKFTAVKNLVDHWQGQNYGNFGIVTSGIGTSGDNIAIDYHRTEIVNIQEAISNLAAPELANGFDFQVDPITRNLILYDPARGTDKSTTVVVDERIMEGGVSIYFDLSAGDFATTIVGAATGFERDGALWTQKENATRRAQFGYAGMGAKWTGIEIQSTLDGYAQALADLHSNYAVSLSGSSGGGEGGTAAIFPVTGIEPPDIDPGDTVSFQPDLGFGSINVARDIVNVGVSVDINGNESMGLVLV